MSDLTGKAFVEATMNSAPLVMFSKTFCPFCKRAKALLGEYTQEMKVYELDGRDDMKECQDALEEIAGKRSVPQVFIGGASIGGFDDTAGLHNAGKLEGLLMSAGVPLQPKPML
mmetsp:Transcript_14207/g.30002  ORF Transcript_14207/g.30002 Transcript_14207/m.30002 type:complete len:114 (-) Transcript_14207:301-642(-)